MIQLFNRLIIRDVSNRETNCHIKWQFWFGFCRFVVLYSIYCAYWRVQVRSYKYYTSKWHFQNIRWEKKQLLKSKLRLKNGWPSKPAFWSAFWRKSICCDLSNEWKFHQEYEFADKKYFWNTQLNLQEKEGLKPPIFMKISKSALDKILSSLVPVNRAQILYKTMKKPTVMLLFTWSCYERAVHWGSLPLIATHRHSLPFTAIQCPL